MGAFTEACKCICFPFLRVDPAQATRFEDIRINTEQRLEEARRHQWLGEVTALEESLRHIRSKRAQLAAADRLF